MNKLPLDNQKLTAKKLSEKPRCHGKPEVMRKQFQHLKDIGFGDKIEIKEIFMDECQELTAKELDAQEGGDLSAIDIIGLLSKQLTETRQKLDGAEEALEDVADLTSECSPSTYSLIDKIINKALNTIKGK